MELLNFLDLLFDLIFIVIIGAFFIAIISVVVVYHRKRGPSETSPRTEKGEPRWVRITERSILGGVCAGFAYKFAVPQWIVRVIWVLLIFSLAGTSIIAYFIFWGFMPKANEFPEDFDCRTDGH